MRTWLAFCLICGPSCAALGAPQNQLPNPLDRMLFAPETPRVAPPPKPAAKASKPTAADESQQPFLEIAQTMQQVQRRLQGLDAGPQTLDMQRQIVADLNRLLRQARTQSQPPPRGEEEPPLTSSRRPVAQPKATDGASGKPSGKPATEGGTRTSAAPAQKPDRERQLQAAREALKRLWGDLPDRAREQMLQQVPVEEFLPQYETLIEAYFRRLTEEQGRGP